MSHAPEAFLRHVRACTNAVLPGGRVRWTLAGEAVGWVPAAQAPPADIADAAALAAYERALAAAGAFRARDERFDVRAEDGRILPATVDRGAIPLLGLVAAGVHANGLVWRAEGLHLWVGERAADKKLDPGKLDHVTAGGVPAGLGPAAALAKEAAEEASLPPGLVATARPVGVLRYDMQRPEGLRRDVLYCYDLDLPEWVQPVPADGEVVRFMLLPVAEVMRLVAETDAFKFNVNLVLIDLFLRLGLLRDGRVAAAMAAVRTDGGYSAAPSPPCMSATPASMAG